MKKLVALLMLVIMGISSICMACADTAIEVNTNLKVKKPASTANNPVIEGEDPFTGLPASDEPFTPILLVLDNSETMYPHYGTSYADIIIQVPNQNMGNNKVLALFANEYPEMAGPCRSSRMVSLPAANLFNACFVVMLTPVSIAIFSWLGKKGLEPKAPVKIGLGMLVAAIAYLLMTVGSIGLPVPEYAADGSNLHMADVSPNLLIETYLVLTFAELLLSPIGISFVTKVAPPKYKGMMMGGWFVSTAIGNFLVQIPGYLWGKDLYIVWGALMVICLIAAVFIFSIIKKLNKVS